MADDDSGSDGGTTRTRSRPETEASYGIPNSDEGLLSWDFVGDQLSGDRNYWVSTTRPDGQPHARPVWGVWLDGTFFCGGGERTRWVRNLDANPRISVHREDTEEVVIIEGTAQRITEETPDGDLPSGADSAGDLVESVDSAYEEKYGTRHGTPFFAVRPETVLAWSDYPADATRWTFG